MSELGTTFTFKDKHYQIGPTGRFSIHVGQERKNGSIQWKLFSAVSMPDNAFKLYANLPIEGHEFKRLSYRPANWMPPTELDVFPVRDKKIKEHRKMRYSK